MRGVKKDILTIITSRDYDELENELSNLKTNQKFLDETLKVASYKGDGKSVEILIKFGANPNYADEFGTTLLHFAIKTHKEDIVLALIKNGAIYDDWVFEGIDLFNWCIRNGWVDIVNYLIKQKQFDPIVYDDMGRTPLHLACMFGQVRIVQYILGLGIISVNARDQNGWTPLHYACSEAGKKFQEVLQVLFSNNADPLLLTDNGKTSLDLAYESGRVQELISVLSLEKMVQQLISVDSVICHEEISSNFISQQRVEENTDMHSSTHKLQERHSQLKLSIWRKILLNDDVTLLQEYRDSAIWCDPINPLSFEESQKFSITNICDIFRESYENGVGIYSHFNHQYRREIMSGKLLSVITQTRDTEENSKLSVGDCYLLKNLDSSILLLAFITGRFKVVELLLRMRQFDIIPACLWICLLVQKLLERKEFPQQIVDNLSAIGSKSEIIAVDALNRVYFIDNSPEKEVTLQFLNTRFMCYGNKSLVDLADAGGCSNFLSLPSCQLILDKRWYGNLRPIKGPIKWVIRLIPISILFYNPYKKRNEHKLREISDTSDTLAHNNTSNSQYSRYNSCEHHSSKSDPKSISRLLVLYSVVNAPGTKFFYHSLSHLVFLLLMSYVLLFDMFRHLKWTEGLCYTFVLGYALEEGVQCCLITMQQGIYEYFSDRWNLLDLTAIIITFIGAVLRSLPIDLVEKDNEYLQTIHPIFYAARFCLLLGLMCFYFRIMFISTISEKLGPKLRMIVDMMKKDFLPLIVLFCIFILAFGIFFQGILYPNNFYYNHNNKTNNSTIFSDSKSETIRRLLRRAIYGIFEADYPIDNVKCDAEDKCVHPIGKEMFENVFLVIYIISVNIMLMNLLIALFSNTVSRIDERSKEHWLAGRYKLVQEYKERSVFPPPFNIFERIYYLLSMILEKIRCSNCIKKSNALYDIVTNDELTIVIKFIIIQSFALKTSRYVLGSKENKDGQNTGLQTDYEMQLLKQKVSRVEQKLDKLMSILSPQPQGPLSNLSRGTSGFMKRQGSQQQSNVQPQPVYEEPIKPIFNRFKFSEPPKRFSISRTDNDTNVLSPGPRSNVLTPGGSGSPRKFLFTGNK